MAIPLAAMARRRKPNARRKSITFRPIVAPAILATDLYGDAFAPIITAWQNAIAPILAQYERTLSAMTQDSPADVGATLDAVEGDLARILLTLRLRIERWALRVERYQRGKWRGAVLSATGVDLDTMLGPEDVRMTVAASIERNVNLVKSVSEQARSKIGEAVFRGLNQRRAAAEVAKEIRGAVDLSRRRAKNIASDQLVKLNASLNSERRRQAGIDTWEWVDSEKQNFRPEHRARRGKRYSDDDAPSDLPGELPYCGCTERAVLSLDSEF